MCRPSPTDLWRSTTSSPQTPNLKFRPSSTCWSGTASLRFNKSRLSLFPEGGFTEGGLLGWLAFAEGDSRRRFAFAEVSGPHLPLAARTGDLDAGALEAFAGFLAFAYGYPIMTLLAVVTPLFLLAIPYGPLVIC